jgi:isocitrate dehydrogenase (NAD+)
MIPVTLIPGDGVGPQVAGVVRDAVARLGAPIAWEEAADVESAIASLGRTRLGLKGKWVARAAGVPTPIRFRKALGIQAIIRHITSLPGLPARSRGVDIAVVREASEDIYAGFEHRSTEGVFESVRVTTRASCERVHRLAFDWARAHGRRRVTTVHKSNILKKSDGMFLAIGQAVAAEYPDLVWDEVIVDALCMKIVRRPEQFDVLVCGNLFGDIVSATVAGMAGGVTVAGGVALGPDVTVFEMPHGTTHALVGDDGANPYPMLGLTVDLLRHVGEGERSLRLRAACIAALEAGLHTQDMGGTSGCSRVRESVLAAL